MAALSPSAVRAANEALWAAHPELKRQQLSPSHPQYEQLKSEWLESYAKAKEPQNAKAVGSPCATCSAGTLVEEREVLEEAARLLQRLVALSTADGLKNTYSAVIDIFAFDSKWHDTNNNQRLFSFRGKTLKGTDLNYYYQGVIWSWLELPKFGMNHFAQLYKLLRWRTSLNADAQWALEQGYHDGPSLLSPAPTKTAFSASRPGSAALKATSTSAPTPAQENSTPGGPLGGLISGGEGGYNSFNHGTAGDSGGQTMDLTNMTLADIIKLQDHPKGDSDRLFAVGKYQLTPTTLAGGIAALGISTDEKYTPELQERLFREYLVGSKRPQVKDYITGKSDDIGSAQLALAREFASVANPNTGISYYDGVGGNSSSITEESTAAALQSERETYQRHIREGMTADEAWLALSR